ncbi:MAG TPA: T9SS type A sorting domain-containing protein, partial [Saprospiraceae bacterium]|nr:T9SS type A sorting domain-containing protein [Saprospiraceae bacterium]
KWLPLPGQPLKLLTGSTVWSVPGLLMEHDYGYQQVVERKWFEFGGERFVAHKAYGGFNGFHFYDAGHNLLKIVDLALPQFNYLDFVSQTYFNADSLTEFFGVTWEAEGPNQRTCRIVREDGLSLFELPCFYAAISTFHQHPDYLAVVRYNSPDALETQLFEPQTLTLVATLPGQATRRLAGVEEAVFLCKQSGDGNPLLCYDAGFQLIQSFDVPASYGHFWYEGVSRNHFSEGGQLEYWFSYLSASNETSVAVLRADGQLLYQFPGARQGLLDHQEGLKDKFLVYYRDSTVVYDFVNEALDANTPADVASWKLAPNPFVHTLHVELPGAAGVLQVFDGLGRQMGVFDINEQAALDLPTVSWPAGVYWLQWQQAGRVHSAKAVKGQ